MGDFIVPVIINQGAMELQRNNISGNTIFVACIIFLHDFVENSSITLEELEKMLECTLLERKEIKKAITELNELKWLEYSEENENAFRPSTVMMACISPELLVEILSKIHAETRDEELKERIDNFLPKEYRKVRRSIKVTKTLFEFSSEPDNVVPKHKNPDLLDMLKQRKDEEKDDAHSDTP